MNDLARLAKNVSDRGNLLLLTIIIIFSSSVLFPLRLLFQPAMPLIGIMCNEALRDRHWDEMSDIANVDLQPNAGTTLEKLMDLKLDDLLNQ